MSKQEKISVIVRVKSHLYPTKKEYYHNLAKMYFSGWFTYDSILAELKQG